MRLCDHFRVSTLLLATILLALLWLTACAPVPASRPTTRFAQKECLDCHTEFADKYLSMPDVHTPVKEQKCEECHLRHGVIPKLLLKQRGNQGCYSCHPKDKIGMDKPQTHSAFRKDQCIRCHNPHASKQPRLLQAPLQELCLQCHKAENYRKTVVHEPVRDNQCLACHESHGSDYPNILKADSPAICLECHDAGKNVFKRAHGDYPVETAACQDCHSPHSSVQPQLLRSTIHPYIEPQTCTRCHESSGSPQPLATIAAGGNLCYQCHKTEELKGGGKHDHLPFKEGKCSLCHKPHTSDAPVLLKAEGNTLCFQCHKDMQKKVETPHGALNDQRGCLACHRRHSAEYEQLLIAKEASVCFKCHADTRSAMRSPAKHEPFVDGSCSACHNPHGSNFSGMVKDREDAVCYACHVDAEIAFTKTVTHQPVQAGQCSACHLSHGAERKDLLKVDPKDPQLCSNCHADLMQLPKEGSVHPAFESGQCRNCHEVHGSNVPGMLTRKQGFLCYTCHGTELVSKRGKPVNSRHQPVSEGQCSTCHNPHKARLQELLLADYPDLCLACHTDLKVVRNITASGQTQTATEKSGVDDEPADESARLYIHAPDDIGNCRICHLPHQGEQAALLTQPIQPLCNKCHDYGAEPFTAAHLNIAVEQMDCRTCHAPHIAQTPRLFKGIVHKPFAQKDCKDCHLIERQ